MVTSECSSHGWANDVEQFDAATVYIAINRQGWQQRLRGLE